MVHNALLDRARRTGAQLLISRKPVRDHMRRDNPELTVNIAGDYLPIDIKLSNAIKMRIERQKKILEGEFDEVVEVVRQIYANPTDKWGRRYNLTVLCGDINRPVNACLTATLEDMIQTEGSNIKLVKANTKTQDLDMWYDAMANPQYDTVITRPNEMLTIAPALGFRTVLLNPFQIHEIHSVEGAMLNAKYSSNLTRFNWLLDTNGRFAGFERGTNISGNYQSSRFWCKAQSLTLH